MFPAITTNSKLMVDLQFLLQVPSNFYYSRFTLNVIGLLLHYFYKFLWHECSKIYGEFCFEGPMWQVVLVMSIVLLIFFWQCRNIRHHRYSQSDLALESILGYVPYMVIPPKNHTNSEIFLRRSLDAAPLINAGKIEADAPWTPYGYRWNPYFWRFCTFVKRV